MIPDNVEKIIMTKEDYDRNVEQLLYDKINAEQKVERLQNIIKEVREYIETIVKNTPSSTRKDYANMILIDYKKLLEILDKGE